MVEAVFWQVVFVFTLMQGRPDDRAVNSVCCVFLDDAVCPLCDPVLSVFCSGGKATPEMELFLILPVLVGAVPIPHWNFSGYSVGDDSSSASSAKRVFVGCTRLSTQAWRTQDM